jgi:CHASE3 domain sensor protein
MTTAKSTSGQGAPPESTVPDAAPPKETPPAAEQALTHEIERIREDLGATVEALVAKTDIRARIRAMMGRLALPLRAATAKAKLRSPAAPAGTTVMRAAPQPLHDARQKTAVTARKAAVTANKAAAAARRRPLAAAGGAAALGSVAAAIVRWRRR